MTAPENPPAPAIAPPPSQRPRPPWPLALAGLALLAFVAWGFWRAAQPPTPYFQGQMEARETDVAGKVTARIARVLVQEGQRIQPGALLVELDSPEVRAKMAQAEAARDAARAQADKAESGARPEEVQMARLAWQRAQAAAEAQTRRAAGAVAEVEAAQAETQLRSPVGGEVAKVLAREGELSPQGVALVTVVDLQDQWLVLNVREDQLGRFAKGSRFSGRLPALDGRTAEFEVYFLGVLPDFATWRATRGSQGFDARTFEVRARPASPIEGARPGMSVIVEDRR